MNQLIQIGPDHHQINWLDRSIWTNFNNYDYNDISSQQIAHFNRSQLTTINITCTSNPFPHLPPPPARIHNHKHHITSLSNLLVGRPSSNMMPILRTIAVCEGRETKFQYAKWTRLRQLDACSVARQLGCRHDVAWVTERNTGGSRYRNCNIIRF